MKNCLNETNMCLMGERSVRTEINDLQHYHLGYFILSAFYSYI